MYTRHATFATKHLKLISTNRSRYICYRDKDKINFDGLQQIKTVDNQPDIFVIKLGIMCGSFGTYKPEQPATTTSQDTSSTILFGFYRITNKGYSSDDDLSPLIGI